MLHVAVVVQVSGAAVAEAEEVALNVGLGGVVGSRGEEKEAADRNISM